MKKYGLLLALFALLSLGAAGTPKILHRTFTDNGRGLINPMMGWVYYYYENPAMFPVADDNDPLEYYEGLSTVYMRIPWAMLEPREGDFRWSIIDAPAQRWIARGKKIALRFFTSYTGVAGYSGTPKWVADAGAKMIPYTLTRNNVTSMEPLFDDPVFLTKLENFIAAAAKKYAHNENIAFIDVGTFGTWGEGHTVNTHKLSQPETDRQTMIHARIWRKYFPDTLLVISDDVVGPRRPGQDFPVMKELRKLGITLRDDSILVNKNWYHSELSGRFWPTMPVVLEHQLLHVSLNDKMWDNELLAKAVEAYHASYLSINYWPDQHYKICAPVMKKINRRLGYRIVPSSIDYPDTIRPNRAFHINLEITNTGVAPCYPGGYPAYTLKNSQGAILMVVTDTSFDVRSLPVGPEGQPVRKKISSCFTLDTTTKLSVGEYDLFFSIGDGMGTPKIALPLDHSDGERRYRIGKIRIDTDYVGRYLGKAYWIWDTKTTRPCKTFVTKTFEFAESPEQAELIVSADDICRVFVNGKELQSRFYRGWGVTEKQNVSALLKKGTNLIAVEGTNAASACGIIAELNVMVGGKKTTIVTDSSWKASPKESPLWQRDPQISKDWAPAVQLRRNGEGVHSMSLSIYR